MPLPEVLEMSLPEVIAAMIKLKENKVDIPAKLNAEKDTMLPRLNGLKNSGDGLVQFVNFVEVLRKQIGSGALVPGKHGMLLWGLLCKLEMQRDKVIDAVQRHVDCRLDGASMARAAQANLDDFKDITLFEEKDLLPIHYLLGRIKKRNKNHTVCTKRLPPSKLANYFQVLQLFVDVFEGFGQ